MKNTRKNDTRKKWRRVYDVLVPFGAGLGFFTFGMQTDLMILRLPFAAFALYVMLYTSYTTQRDDL